MSAKQQAIEDIKADLVESSRVFLAFHKELNPEIDNLVKEYTARQESLNHKHQKKELALLKTTLKRCIMKETNCN